MRRERGGNDSGGMSRAASRRLDSLQQFRGGRSFFRQLGKRRESRHILSVIAAPAFITPAVFGADERLRPACPISRARYIKTTGLDCILQMLPSVLAQ